MIIHDKNNFKKKFIYFRYIKILKENIFIINIIKFKYKISDQNVVLLKKEMNYNKFKLYGILNLNLILKWI